MANNCMTSLRVMREEAITEKEADAIVADIRENIEYTGGAKSYRDENSIEWNGDTRWNVPTDALVELAKRHRVSIRAIGREDGNGFMQVVCINEGGAIVQDDEIDYAL